MGKTTYPDTNNQFAYRTQRDAFLRGIRDRALTLWMDGYRVQPMLCEPDTFLVSRESETAGYKVNPVAQTCSCRFCTEQETTPLDPMNPTRRVHCKHLLGLRLLIGEELDHWRMRYLIAQRTISPLTGSAERAASYRERWDALSTAWMKVEETTMTLCSSWEDAEELGLLECCSTTLD